VAEQGNVIPAVGAAEDGTQADDQDVGQLVLTGVRGARIG